MICKTQSSANTNDNRFAISKEDCLGNAPTAFPAETIWTSTANFADSETVVIDGKTYTFETTLTNVNGNVQIGPTLQDSLINLINAINLDGVAGTQYALATTVHPSVGAVGINDTSLKVEALVPGPAGNTLAVSDTAANGSFATATLEGGRINQWLSLDVNTVDGLGNTTETAKRVVISDNRANLPGGIVGVESNPSFEHDLTYSLLEHILPAAMYAEIQGAKPIKPATVTGTQITMTAVTTPDLALFLYGATTAKSLYKLSGFSNQSNNGIKVASAAATATSISLAGLTAETASATQLVEHTGLRAPSGDLSIARNQDKLTLTSAGGTNFLLAGLKRGMGVFVGGDLALNRFATGACYGRVREVTATSLVIDTINAKSESTVGGLQNMTAPDLGTGREIDLFFGRFCISVPKSSPLYKKESFTIERVQGFTGRAPQYTYSVGNLLNELTLQMEAKSKTTMNLSMSGQITERVSSARKPGASNVVKQDKQTMYNTSTDIARIFLLDSTGKARTSRLSSATLTINNNITGEPALGEIGDVAKPEGAFDVTIQFSSHLQDLTIVNSIIDNTPFQFNFVKRNLDGTIIVDAPSGKLGDTSDQLEPNQVAKLDATYTAELDNFFNTSLQISLIPYTPAG